jgi:hypothetical protein
VGLDDCQIRDDEPVSVGADGAGRIRSARLCRATHLPPCASALRSPGGLDHREGLLQVVVDERNARIRMTHRGEQPGVARKTRGGLKIGGLPERSRARQSGPRTPPARVGNPDAHGALSLDTRSEDWPIIKSPSPAFSASGMEYVPTPQVIRRWRKLSGGT